MMEKDAIEVMLNHRSIRKFTAERVDKALLAEIVECGLRASNTGNMQLYSVIATEEEPLRTELCGLHFGQCATAPLWLTVCVDVNRYHHYCRVNGCDEPYGNLLWVWWTPPSSRRTSASPPRPKGWDSATWAR